MKEATWSPDGNVCIAPTVHQRPACKKWLRPQIWSLDGNFYIAPYEQFISGRSSPDPGFREEKGSCLPKKEMAKAVDFETRLQFLHSITGRPIQNDKKTWPGL
ncbi:MAG: hypothetical protein NXI25_26605 [bacterium]|nr:hypothetical protein [bacterium]